jgi:tRNA(Ile)-lysidine synthase
MINKELNLDKNKKYLLACSFGPDSMALFGMLLKGNYDFSVANVNYHMRGDESDKESINLKEYCKKNNIPYYRFDVQGPELEGNFQSAARKERYKFFSKLQHEKKFDNVLIAHNLDDKLTTFLLQKARKTDVFYFGLKEETVIEGANIIRPLLDMRKKDLEQYCIENNIPYGIDSSNKSTKYSRNKIMINKVSKLTDDEINEILLEIEEKNDKNLKLLDELKDFNEITPFYSIEKLKKLELNDQIHVLYYLYSLHGLETKFSRNKAINILSALLSNRVNFNRKISDDNYLIKGYDYFFFSKVKNSAKFSITLQKPCKLIYKHISADLSNPQVIGASIDDFPLTIRSYEDDDYYQIKDYKKRVNRLYIDMKLPTYFRNAWPIVVSKSGKILYIPRYRSGYIPKKSDVFAIRLRPELN